MTENNLPAVFNFQNHEVRTITDEQGNPWWVAKDVADILGYKDTVSAIKQHCRGVVKHHPLQTPGGIQDVRVIPESDLYRLIAKSKLPSAEKFEAWIFEEVLPTIRKTGSYKSSTITSAEFYAAMNKPEILRLAANLAEENEGLKTTIKEIAPKAEALDRISTADGLLCISDAAKALQLNPQKKLFDRLHADSWTFRRDGKWVATAAAIKQGLMYMKVHTINKPDGSEKNVQSTYVTGKGLARLAEKFQSGPFV